MTMDAEPEFSVLLSVWNGMPYLRESIASVLSQAGVRFELLVIDDGSTDGSESFITGLSDPRVRKLPAARRAGLYANLNRMLIAARAPLVRIWAQDDVMLPGCLANVRDFHHRHEHVAVAYCGAAVLDPAGRLSTPADDHTPELMPPDVAAWFMLLHGSLCGSVSTRSARRDRLRSMDGFPQHIAGDFALIEHASIAAPLGHIRMPGVAIRVHDRQWSRMTGANFEILLHGAAVWRAVLARVQNQSAFCAPHRARSLLAEGVARTNGLALLRAMALGRWLPAWRVARAYEGFVRWHEWPCHGARRVLGFRRRLA
jgi:glycosyltransferase involved in cell wall biosynthesis